MRIANQSFNVTKTTHLILTWQCFNSSYLPLSRISLKTLLYSVMGLIASIFFAACMCLMCRCCCRDSRSKRYRDKNGTLLNRSSFHSQQRLHGHQSPNVNGSLSRNMNSRLSLRTPGHVNGPSGARGIHHLK